MKTFLTGGITAVPGILAAGMAAGIKKADVPDLALIVSEREATAAGGFTLNKGGAAPGPLDPPRLRRGKGRALPANMATMLAFLATDAVIPHPVLQRGLRQAADRSFNLIPVDGDTSTNDMVLCLANGVAGNRPIASGSADARRFQALLDVVCLDLAKKIAWDGEGATKFVELRVTRARTPNEAVRVAVAIATSSLVKTAWFGADANWGRIMAAIGRSGARINPDRVAIAYRDVPVVRRGTGLGPAAEERANTVLKGREFALTVDLGLGRAEATVWTTDLSPEDVKINASYRS